MKRRVTDTHPIRAYFTRALDESLHDHLGLERAEDVEAYLVQMLVEFMHHDAIFGIRDAAGHRVESVVEMIAEGDIRLRADSFEREREVHRHIGDYLLFWSGVFPEFLKFVKAPGSRDALVDVVQQGKFSYYVVSTFNHQPYREESRTFERLSSEFESYQKGLRLVRASFEGFALQGWPDGFEA